MSIDKLLAALIMGLSWERVLCCPFLALSLSLSGRGAGVKFLLGRLLGIVILGLIVTLVGLPFHISPRIVDSIFGIFLIGLSIRTFFEGKHKNSPQRLSQVGFGLGLFRGFLNPGRKIICLFPLLWGAGIFEGGIISLVYALSSSFYLLVGFFSAEVINKLVSYKKIIRISGAVILFILGVFYILWKKG